MSITLKERISKERISVKERILVAEGRTAAAYMAFIKDRDVLYASESLCQILEDGLDVEGLRIAESLPPEATPLGRQRLVVIEARDAKCQSYWAYISERDKHAGLLVDRLGLGVPRGRC